MDRLRGFIKPPFANYDIVVYFGGGLFFVLFLYRYLLEPLGLGMPDFRVPLSEGFLAEAVATLSTLFTIYVASHILAYAASQLIEKSVDRVFGKISTAIFVSARTSASSRDEWIRAVIFDRLSQIRRDRAGMATTVRFMAHLPLIPFYLVIFGLGIFGYYDTRVPQSVMHVASRKLRELPDLGQRIGLRNQWYKPLEYYVINKRPDAVNRMYNYLVISGLFRTLCLIFLFGIWMQGYFLLHYLIDGEWLLGSFMKSVSAYMGIVEFGLLVVAYLFSLFSYLKFQRRYAEEAIFAFAFDC